MNYPLSKYRFYQAGKTGNKIVAVSTFASQPVRGVAVCHESDTFDLETGKQLAALRCNERVAAKRLSRAGAKFKEAEAAVKAANARLEQMRSYLNDSVIAYNEAAIEVDNFTAKLGKKN